MQQLDKTVYMERLQIRTQTQPKKHRWEPPTCENCSRPLCQFRKEGANQICNLWKSGYKGRGNSGFKELKSEVNRI